MSLLLVFILSQFNSVNAFKFHLLKYSFNIIKSMAHIPLLEGFLYHSSEFFGTK
jgi:hypothetical protein